MLEVRNLTKIYKDKGGTEARALDGVSVKFGETGLVFILGKSGCGKSTFLNIVGGLDTPTSGEVIVNGKSSKDFSQKDFDSYRNTYVGFVFQEYNVLNEFSVEDNVALALELQSQSKTKEKVQEILKEVELDRFAKRKPNTLSGGQKQRIAIARALVKDPQIIMADEPTGALDSNTGRQVLDTLKELSKTRLVIVVSHDREFAQEYGDRIIELSDGRMIADITKVYEHAEEISSNVRQIGNEILSIEDGSQLTYENYVAIQRFISSQHGVMIVSGDKEIVNTKKANRIAEDNSREAFMDTEETPAGAALAAQTPGEGDGKLIRSRLPIAKAIKMGASSLKGRPVRLVLTILLSTIAFVVFGLLSCFMTYNGNTVAASTFANGDENFLTLRKRYVTNTYVTTYQDEDEDYEYETYYNTYFRPEDAATFGFGSSDVLYGTDNWFYINNVYLNEESSGSYYNFARDLNKVVYVPEGNQLRSSMVCGTYPETADEVCISRYVADYLLNCTIYWTDYDENGSSTPKSVSPESYNKLVGTKIESYSDSVTISGVIDVGDIPSEYDYMKDGEAKDTDWGNFNNYMQDGIDLSLFVSEDYIEAPSSSSNYWDEVYNYFDEIDANLFLTLNPTPADYYFDQSTNYAAVYDESRENVHTAVFTDGRASHTLKSRELVIPLYTLRNAITSQFGKYSNQYYDSDDFTSSNYYKDTQGYSNPDTGERIYSIYEVITTYMEGGYNYSYEVVEQDADGNPYTTWEYEYHYLTDTERKAIEERICTYLNNYPLDLILYQYTHDWSDQVQIGSFRVAGFYFDESNADESNQGIYCSADDFNTTIRMNSHRETTTNYVRSDDEIYSYMIVPIEKSQSWVKSLLSKLNTVDETTSLNYYMQNNLYSDIERANETVSMLSLVFLIAGLVFAIFAALLLFNFISASISNKQKEIGILRAVGARSSDVFKIFFSESIIIALICLVLAVIVTAILAAFANSIMYTIFGLLVTIVVFTPICVLMMLAIAVVVAFLGTFFPVYFTAKKKPVDAIRTL